MNWIDGPPEFDPPARVPSVELFCVPLALKLLLFIIFGAFLCLASIGNLDRQRAASVEKPEMTSPMPPEHYTKPEVISWDTLQNIRALTANGPAKDWQTRPQRYQEFMRAR